MTEDQNQSVVAINQNEPVDNTLSERLKTLHEEIEFVRTARPQIESVQALLEQAQRAMSESQSAISNTAKELGTEKEDISVSISELKKSADLLGRRLLSAERRCVEAEGFMQTIETNAANAQRDRALIEEKLNEVNVTKNQFDGLRDAVSAEIAALRQEAGILGNLGAEIKKAHGEAQEMHSALFDNKVDEQGNVTHPSYQSELDTLQDKAEDSLVKLNDATKKIITETEALKSKLEQEIRSLLPGAGAAGLSSSYHDAASRYNKTDVAFGNYVMFITPLLIISFMYYSVLTDPNVDATNFGTWFVKLLITVPLGIVSWFGNSSIRMNRRMYEEYNYKQRIMELYHSFKKEIDQFGSEEHKLELLSIMLKAVNDKPTIAMNKYDKGIESLSPIAAMTALVNKAKGEAATE